MPRRYRKKKGLNARMRSVEAKVSKQNQVERKYKDTTLYAATGDHVNTTGSIIPMCLLGQGAARNQRIGSMIQARRIHMRGYFRNNSGTPEDCVIRFIIFRAHSSEGVLPTWNKILDAVRVNAYRELDNKEGYTVIYDHTFSMDTATHSIIPFKFSKLLNTKIEYTNGAAATEATLLRNGYYAMYMSNVSGTTNDPRIVWESRLTFADV